MRDPIGPVLCVLNNDLFLRSVFFHISKYAQQSSDEMEGGLRAHINAELELPSFQASKLYPYCSIITYKSRAVINFCVDKRKAVWDDLTFVSGTAGIAVP